jgi:hypothetical protein
MFPPQSAGLVDRLADCLVSEEPARREAAALALAALPAAAGAAAEPYLLPLAAPLLQLMADKTGAVRDAALAAGAALAGSLRPRAAGLLLPVLFEHTDPLKRWQAREGALRMLAAAAGAAPGIVAARLPEIVPLISALMNDARDQVWTRQLPCSCPLASCRVHAACFWTLEAGRCSRRLLAIGCRKDVPNAVPACQTPSRVSPGLNPFLAAKVELRGRGPHTLCATPTPLRRPWLLCRSRRPRWTRARPATI